MEIWSPSLWSWLRSVPRAAALLVWKLIPTSVPLISSPFTPVGLKVPLPPALS